MKNIVLFLMVLMVLTSPDPVDGVPTLNLPGYQMERFATYGGSTAQGFAFNSTGDLFFTGFYEDRILRIPAPFQPGLNAYHIFATGISDPTDLTFTTDDRLFVTSSGSNQQVFEVNLSGTFSPFAAGFSAPTSIESYHNNLFVTNSDAGTIVKVDLTGNTFPFLSGFINPYGLSSDPAGNFYFVEHATGKIYMSDPSGNVTLLGETGTGFGGAVSTRVSPDGRIFVGDQASGTIYEIDMVGNLSIFASGFRGRGHPVIGPSPGGIAFDKDRNMYIGDGPDIWKISAVASPIIPEPSTLLLLCVGIIGIALYGYRRRKKAT